MLDGNCRKDLELSPLHMRKKHESWAGSKFPEPHKLSQLLLSFSPREQVIMVSSFLDSLLGDLIAKQLLQNEKEISSFLGFDGDGRAPVASFGARIQLAYLLSLIDDNELKALRAVKKVRNAFAHRVVCSFDDEDVVEATKTIIDALEQTGEKYVQSDRARLSDTEWQDSKTKHLGLEDGRIGFFTGAAIILIVQMKKMLEQNAA